MRVFALLAFVLAACGPQAASAQIFVLPIDCDVGGECVIQNYVDYDTSANAEDPLCGPMTYDGHDGLDFRAPAAMAARGVNVLAPAAGVIASLRDGEPDGAFLSGGAAAINGRECGNGVVIEHEDGWSSQLCHLRRGSLRVREGQRVNAGDVIGLVGLSGHTEFPHVHLALRRNGETLDPLTGEALGARRCGGPIQAGAHWDESVRGQLSYRSAHWFAFGFTGTAPAEDANAEDLPANTARDAPALVFWALAVGPKEGDVLRVRLYGPGDALIGEATRTQPRDQAQAHVFTGRRTPEGGWPAGNYRGEARLERGGQLISTASTSLVLR